MIKKYFDLLDGLPLENRNAVAGYSFDEIKRIEALYNVEIREEFLEFMLIAGRCDGGLVGDDPFLIYRPTLSVRSQLLVHIGLIDDLQDIGAFDFLNKPFVISCESETQYYFLRTGTESQLIYHFDENQKKVSATNFSLSEYLVDAYRRHVLDNPSLKRTICRGELINF